MISETFTIFSGDNKGNYVVDFNPKLNARPCIDSIDVFRVIYGKGPTKYIPVFHPEVLQAGIKAIEKQLSFRGNRLRAVK